MQTSRSLYRRHRFPSEIANHSILLYFRFSLSYRDVEGMMRMRGTTAVQSAAEATGSNAANEADARRAEITREQVIRSKELKEGAPVEVHPRLRKTGSDVRMWIGAIKRRAKQGGCKVV